MLLEEYRARLQRAEDRQLQHSIQRVIDIFQSSLFQALIGTYARETASQVLDGACMRMCVCPDRKLHCPRRLLIGLFVMEDVSLVVCCAPPAACPGCRPLVPQDGALAAVLTVAVHFLQQVLPVHAGTGSCDNLVDQSHVGKRSLRGRMPPPQKTPQRVVQWVELSVIPVWTRRLPLCVIPPKQQSSSGRTGLILTDCLNIWNGLWHRPGILRGPAQVPIVPARSQWLGTVFV